MNKLKKYFTIFLLSMFLIVLFKYNNILNKSVIDAVNLWLNNIFPSLFIMFILNDIIIETDIFAILNYYLNPLFNKIFKTSGNSFQAFLLSIFSGTPTSSFIISEMLQNNQISVKDANKLICFTYFANPLFLYNILSLTFNKSITIKIIIIHYITNILIGLLMANFQDFKEDSKHNYKINVKTKNLFTILPQAISKSMNTLLMILGTITFYKIITNIIFTILPISNNLNIIFKGVLEITQSLADFPLLELSNIKKEILAIFLISFGGLSIHTQVMALIKDTPILYRNFLLGRIMHAILSTIICATYFFISYGTIS